MNTHSPAITNAMTRRAATRLIRPETRLELQLRRHATRLAKTPHQSLRRDEPQRRRQVVRRNANIDQSCDGGGCIVGMQRRKHKMTGLRGLHGDVGRFGVADFADHDHVRVLPHERAQRDRESEARFVADTDLINSGKLDFGGIFDGTDVA